MDTVWPYKIQRPSSEPFVSFAEQIFGCKPDAKLIEGDNDPAISEQKVNSESSSKEDNSQKKEQIDDDGVTNLKGNNCYFIYFYNY